VGHGTGVASAAAGNLNTSPATASSGGALSFSGMAPKAFLGNYKILGTPGVNDGFGSEDVMIEALTDAMTDGMDVVTTSVVALPATSGALDTSCSGKPCDPLAYAFEMAAQKGMVITAAAGNQTGDQFGSYQNYPYFNSIASPATAPSVISVGATLNSHVLTPAVSVNSSSAPSNLKGIPAESSFPPTFFPSTQGANAAPLVDITQMGADGYACSALPAGSLNGVFALIERSPATNGCSFTTKVTNAQAAGAAGVVLYMYDSSTPFPPDISESTFIGPVVMISNSAGTALKAYLDSSSSSHPGEVVIPVVTIDSAGTETPLATYDTTEQLAVTLVQNQLASYNSFGPSPDGLIKPDLVATGGLDPGNGGSSSSGMYMATQNYDPNGALYSSDRYAAADGTSFATPLVAGAAALLKQAHPTYTGPQIKSALVNFSARDTTTDDGYIDNNFNQNQPQTVTPEWMGAGRLDANAATGATIAIQPATVSFGYLQNTTTLPITKPLTVTNQGSSSVTLSVAAVAGVAATGATVSVDKSSLAIPPSGSATLNVMLAGSVPSAGAYSGQITLQASGLSLHVPYLFLVGSGVPYNAIPFTGGEGVPGQDIGANLVQVIDQFGVPVSGTPVSFSAPRGSMVFNSVTGSPACTGSGSSSVTCNTDKNGFAWADVVLGSSIGSPAITAGPKGLTQAFATAILPQPTITQGQVLDNAAFLPTIAPGSIVAIKGSNLMNASELVNTAQGYDLSSSPYACNGICPGWSLVLDGVNVSFDVPSANISVPAPIVAVSPGQINVQVPWELNNQTSAQLKVIIDEVIFSNVVTAAVSNYTPAFFTNSGNVADALDTNYKVITTSNPAIRGNYIQLYANGLGPVTTTPADGFAPAGNTNTTQSCTVSIGGQPATVAFCGMPQGLAVYQVNAQVPTNITAGSQSITITIGGKTSPTGIVIPVQ
ncbi:MAG: S8 family serine peptidase, partial [Acidobacteriia bacterium]|nr:S8 family serine peptidase [Terriglobia bacterium]